MLLSEERALNCTLYASFLPLSWFRNVTVTSSSDQFSECPGYDLEVKIEDIAQVLGKLSLRDNSQSAAGTNPKNDAYVAFLQSST
jgi:hypothetical protein